MKALSLLLFLCALLALSQPAALNGTVRRSGSCSPGWTRVKGRCYHVFPFGATWHRAQENCRSIQAHLASIHDYEVNNQLVRMIMSAGRGHTAVWIGDDFTLQERHWRWVDGSPFNYSNWYVSTIQRVFVCFPAGHRCWDDAQCNFRRPFICVKNI
uniref:C-type lectin domain-containing protein n=1 Tax=Xiphophorus couchianus TaxID=32473 RepID=A0A3B5LKT5_9TELE